MTEDRRQKTEEVGADVQRLVLLVSMKVAALGFRMIDWFTANRRDDLAATDRNSVLQLVVGKSS